MLSARSHSARHQSSQFAFDLVSRERFAALVLLERLVGARRTARDARLDAASADTVKVAELGEVDTVTWTVGGQLHRP